MEITYFAFSSTEIHFVKVGKKGARLKKKKKKEGEERDHLAKRMRRVMISFLHIEDTPADKLQMSYKQVVLVTIRIAALVYMH